MTDAVAGSGPRDVRGEPARDEGPVPAQEAGTGSASAGPGGGESDTRKPETGERAEPASSRTDEAGKRADPSSPGRRFSWRTPIAVVLIVVGCVFAPLSVVAVWTANQVSDTGRFVANMEPLIHEPAIQRALTDKITTEITARLKVEALADQASATLAQHGLDRAGTLLHSVAGSLASGVNGYVHTEVAKVIASPQAASLWSQLNRSVHAELVKALSGRGTGVVTSRNGQVVLDLGPVINEVKSHLTARGFTLASDIPDIHPTIALFSAKYLAKGQQGYRLLNDLKIVLPLLTLVLLGLGVWAARRRRRALIGAALGLAASMLVLGAGLAVFRSVYLSSVPASVLPADAAAVLYDDLVRFLRDGLRVLLVTGLIVAVAAFFTGPSATAARTRHAFSSGLGLVRAGGERAGLRTGPVGRWTYTYRRPLRVSAAAIAALIFVFWSSPTWVTALVIAIVLLIVLGLIKLIGTPPATSS